MNARFDYHPAENQRAVAFPHRPSTTETTVGGLEAVEDYARPVRETDRLASTHFTSIDVTSQPNSPTTPVPLPTQTRSSPIRVAAMADVAGQRRRPSIRHQHSTVSAADVDEFNGDSLPSDDAPDAENNANDEMQAEPGIHGVTTEDGEGIIPGASLDIPNPIASEADENAGIINIARTTPIEGSIGPDNTTPRPNAPIDFSPARNIITPPQPSIPSPYVARYLLERQANMPTQHTAVMPREEDVLMSLQLLAYVSKYCALRTYFQQSHLVPKLRVDKSLANHDGDADMETEEDLDKQEDEEYLLPNDFNLFPLVEKFTMRHHSTDMQYWAGVVMRNLCRKDDTKGGIRQCAYYQCGKWEEYTRQFAKMSSLQANEVLQQRLPENGPGHSIAIGA